MTILCVGLEAMNTFGLGMEAEDDGRENVVPATWTSAYDDGKVFGNSEIPVCIVI